MPVYARVTRAREALAAKAEAAVELMHHAATIAADKGNHAPTAWMLEHMSATDPKGNEVRPIASGIDRQALQDGPRGPTINIGWVTAAPQPALPTVTVKALPESSE